MLHNDEGFFSGKDDREIAALADPVTPSATHAEIACQA
jgi:hypothetical protein